MRIAIDLTWVKHKQNGGIESYIRNVLDGLSAVENDNKYVLFTARDNAYSFKEYLKDKRFTMHTCDISACGVAKRIIWHNINFNKILVKSGIKNCFMPVYCKPLLKNKNIKYITTIHDLQQWNFPQYFSKKRVMWMKFAWKRAAKTSDMIVAISDFAKNDIMEKLKLPESKIRRIYNPIVIDNGFAPADETMKRFNVEENQYMFLLAASYKHKNIMTAIKVMEKIKNNNIDLPHKLIMAGTAQADKKRLEAYILEHDLSDECIMTGFISNEERNTLFKNSYAFLFPSVFEGFGMPVVEGLMLGARVVTTDKTSIYEVSEGKAVYVKNPYDTNEWIEKLIEIKNNEKKVIAFEKYDKKAVALQYIELFGEVYENTCNNTKL